MHDSQIEDRLRAVLRTEGEAPPLTITPDELERRLALRRRERNGRRLSLVAAGLAVIAVGSVVATTAGWIRTPSVGTGPEASTRPLETPHASLEPAATPLAGISPLVAIPGRIELIRIDPAGPIDQANGTATAATQGTSVVASISCIGEGRLEMAIDGISQGMGCASLISRSPNVWFDVTDRQVDLTYSATGPISFAILVERPGDGEQRPTGDEPFCELVDPSLSTAPPSVGAGVVPGDTLRYGGLTSAYQWNHQLVGNPGLWEDVPTDLQIVAWPEVEAIAIAAYPLECLYDVQAEALLTNTAEPNPAPITLAIQRGVGTRLVEIELPQVGVWLVRVRASFATADGSPGWSETIFRVIVLSDGPTLTMSGGPDGNTATAEAGCPSYQLASGANASDSCGAPYAPLDGIEPVTIRSGESVDLALSGNWRMDQVRIIAVDTDLVRAGELAPEYSVAFREDGGDRLSVPIELDPGSWIVRVSLNGRRGGDTFDAYYDLPLIVRE